MGAYSIQSPVTTDPRPLTTNPSFLETTSSNESASYTGTLVNNLLFYLLLTGCKGKLSTVSLKTTRIL
jgi:hypothetical protein